MNKNEKLERERSKLHELIETGASVEAIQSQSEALDKLIVDFYSSQKQYAV